MVPEAHRIDYGEACEVMTTSPKASAALSRRILQAVLSEQGYSQHNLADQIDAVLKETKPVKALPTLLRDTIDVIRNFGNFSAHRITDKSTLQIIDVELGEAEWCLDIIEQLFDHYYVKSEAIIKKKMLDLNAKLTAAGKAPAKS